MKEFKKLEDMKLIGKITIGFIIAEICALIAIFISHLITKDSYWHGWAGGITFGIIWTALWFTI